MTPARVAVRHLVVQFPAVRALDDVTLEFLPGEVHGVVGENGAGKSTLMRVLAGLQAPTAGEVLFDGEPVRLHGPGDAMRRGVAMIHQELNLVRDLDVAANVFLGREAVRGGRLDRAAMRAEAAALLARVGAPFGPDVRLGDLPLAHQQLVEIAKALGQHARTLILDEPTAVLSDRETEFLFRLIRELRAEGVTMVYISHRLAEIPALCDRVTVLRDGRWVETRPAADADPGELARAMVGRQLGDVFPPRTPPPAAPPVLELRGVRLGDGPAVSLAVAPGEIVGLAGLVGAGRTELAEAVAGLRPRAGEVAVDGRTVRPNDPRAARDAGIGYVSEDRKGAGLHVELDAVVNTTLANLRAYVRAGRLRPAEERAAAERWVARLNTKVGDLRAPVRLLSGGNQQKIALARPLDAGPRALLLDEPTRGVDVGAKREIYHLIHGLAAEGLACVVISSELPELLGLCHRIVVLREGAAVADLPGETATEEAIMPFAAGVAASPASPADPPTP